MRAHTFKERERERERPHVRDAFGSAGERAMFLVESRLRGSEEFQSGRKEKVSLCGWPTTMRLGG